MGKGMRNLIAMTQVAQKSAAQIEAQVMYNPRKKYLHIYPAETEMWAFGTGYVNRIVYFSDRDDLYQKVAQIEDLDYRVSVNLPGHYYQTPVNTKQSHRLHQAAVDNPAKDCPRCKSVNVWPFAQSAAMWRCNDCDFVDNVMAFTPETEVK